MLASTMNTHFIALLPTVLLFSAQGMRFPRYSYLDHPMYSLPQFENSRPTPVIMKKYYRIINGAKTTNGALFVPQVSAYDLYPAKERFAINLDALYVDGPSKSQKLDDYFLHLELNNDSRVFLLLNGPGINSFVLKNLTSVTGLEENWHSLRAIQSCNGSAIPVGDSERLGRQLSLPSFSAMIETNVARNEILKIPHPGLVKLNSNLTVSRYTLLFAQPDWNGSIPVPFEYPASPTKVIDLISQAQVHVVPALPNILCPTWLHDLYMEPSRDFTVAGNEDELPYWRTWHAVIDPIYWCYFNHEHGSFPGKRMPVFGYTAWKTQDASTIYGRQDESHAGFKVFSFPLPVQRKFIMITLHMHLSRARRFREQFHTLSFAVMNERWEFEMELHMKADFGAAQATLADGSSISINSYEEGIQKQLLRDKKIHFRRFNVLNVNSSYPESVDTSYFLHGRLTPTESNRDQIRRGIYEQWLGFLNTCTWTKSSPNRGFNFDTRDPATAMRALDKTTDEEMQDLSGDSINRVIVISRNTGLLEVGIDHCFFDVFRSDSAISLERSGGVFYTDAYFSVIRNGSGRNNVRQFIKPEFGTVKFKEGIITPTEPWNGHMEYQEAPDLGRIFINVERAVNASCN